ncbi:3-hydroxyacyl-CoA dehydrogenase NAD-binding domain-containing protein [Nocardioides panaciterrulae]|uniref:3-hydroxyacyl-CoA dehydrogenase n=1 Tax=Nocardioides panaciterrulae TaxID=661492 RepID=A0A7Y9E5L3_9ACTN|nr:3-hydroxyacyl-CoA dehydrogenase NAD-binding domain-containing protein [Nocardioides panaciterrulae]NYD41266.1 3-hydroxyacyl-CoA dehydrogenase [Nocardioides panaciterrulae]
MIPAAEVRTVAVVGAGSIGASWTALLLGHGLHVVAADPAAGAEERLRRTVADRARDLGRTVDQDALRLAGSAGEAAALADLVIECGPERLATKRALFAEMDAAAGPGVLLTSSSSGLVPSSFQDACRHPERVLVAHPFNPPHLVPLVEVVGGRLTSDEAVAAAMAFLRRIGRQPIHLRRELPGHVANRLQAALWREAYHLVAEGAVSVADLDTAISAGPGLRWALLGPVATQHLSGGEGGLGHVLAHLGPPMVEWWADLGSPELTPELVARLVAGVHEELDGTPAEELTARRDRALLELRDIKARHGLDDVGTAGE